MIKCKWCGKKLDSTQWCYCNDNISYHRGANAETLRLFDVEIANLIAMRAEYEQLKAEAERTRWHSVAEEGLPKKSGRYLVLSKLQKNSPIITTLYIFKSGEFYDNNMSGYTSTRRVIAWAELPKGYKEV